MVIKMDKTFCPKVSVIIPAYKASDYLAEAIDSVLSQTYPNIEILVINDGSPDDGATERLALSYGDKIRYFAKENGGVSSALNLGIDNMTGEYFSWLSHDDAYTKDKIAAQVASLKDADKNTVSLCSHFFIDKDSKPITAHKAITPAGESRLLSNKEALNFMLNHGSYNGCAFLIPKEVFSSGLRFREDLRYSQDMLMWTHIFLNGASVRYIPDECVLSRIHAAQQTQTKRGLLRHDSLEIAKEIAHDLAKESEEKYPLLFAYAKRNATLNNKEAVTYAKAVAKEHKLFSVAQKISLFGVSLYGAVRPMLRRIYYRIFIKTKTQ